MPLRQPATASKTRAKLKEVLRGLGRVYGRVAAPARYRGAGLDHLIQAMLAQNTNMANASRGYRMLRRRFPTWAKVMDAPRHEVQREIAICGLARMRARRLQDLLRRVKADRGALSLDDLADEPTDAAFEQLLTYHGIGPKTAAFTLLFAFGHPLLPVDNGILRVLRRLRLVRAKARDLEAERVLSPLIPKGRHYEMHVLLFRHAKEKCRPRNPRCDECTILKICPHGHRVIRHRPPDKALVLPLLLKRKKTLSRYISDGVIKHGDEE